MFNPPRRESIPMIPGAVPRFPVEPHGMLPRCHATLPAGERIATPLADEAAADQRVLGQIPVRHYSVPDFDAIRSPSAANLQNFYATQRYQARPAVPQQPQATEPESILQAKRRAAAQRERELRNYHQEQQYNRSSSSNPVIVKRDPAYRGPLAVLAEINSFGKDHVVSPGAMSEEDRRDLIARQHRALYSAHSEGAHSEDGNNHLDDGSRNLNLNSNGASAPASNASGTRGSSPSPSGLKQNGRNGNVDATAVHTPASEHPPNGSQNAGAVSPNHARVNSGSPSMQGSFSLSANAYAGVQGFSNRTNASSPGGSPSRAQRGSVAPGSSSVAPIGTRPSSQAQNQALNDAKRSTTPLASPLSYGFRSSESDSFNNLPKERASSEQHSTNAQGSDGLGWSKVWGPGSKGLNNVASVWG